MLASIPFSVTGLASPATNRSWRRKQVLVTGTWDGGTCSPGPFILGTKETPALTLLPRHWGARASFCKNSFFFSFRGHGDTCSECPAEALWPPNPLGSSWAEAGAPSFLPGRKLACSRSTKDSQGADKLCMLIAPVLGKQALCWGKAAAGAPALCWPWLDPEWMAAMLPLFQGRALDRMPPQAGPALPQATLSHLCPARGDPGEHLLQAAHRLNIRANLDQQVLLKCANHLLFLSCF